MIHFKFTTDKSFMFAQFFHILRKSYLLIEFFCASIALDTSFASSDDQTFVVNILFLGIPLSKY